MLTEVSSSKVRVAMRLYFLVVLTVLSIIGDQCNAQKIKLAMLQNKKVAMSSMTGWISGILFFWNSIKLRALPGGWRVGTVMGLAALLGLSADLMVSYLVRTMPVVRRCDFGTGMVISTSGDYIWSTPPNNGRPYTVAANAQITSVGHGGPYGIYKKVNEDSSFKAEAQDVIAGFSCAQIGSDIVYDPDQAAGDIAADLVTRDLMYEDNIQYATNADSHTHTTHLVVWGVTGADGSPFKSAISVQQGPDAESPKTMRTYGCSVETTAVDHILASIEQSYLLQEWSAQLQGGCYNGAGTPAIDNTTTFLEQYLNTVVMVQGGQDSLLGKPADGDDTTQGCIRLWTYISPAVLIVMAVAAGLLLGTFVYWLLLYSSVRHLSKRLQAVKYDIPDGTTGWMIQAIREHCLATPDSANTVARLHVPRKTHELKQWCCRLVIHGAIRMVKIEERRQYMPLASQGAALGGHEVQPNL